MSKQDFFFLSPVLVMKVTNNNLDEVAEWCGGLVQEVESRRVQGRMDKYVLVPTPKESKVSWAFPGMFVTKRLVITMKGELKATWAVFRRDYFEKNYFESPDAASAATWEREHDESLKPKEEVVVTVNVGEAMHEAALEKIRKIASQAGGNVTINVNQEQPFSHKEGAELVQESGTEVSLNDTVDDGQLEIPMEPETIAQADNPELNIEDLDRYVHDHASDEGCDVHECETERYADGVQQFTDKTFICTPDKGAVELETTS